MTSTIERHEFQAETKELLHLMIHSLYQHREIFLRELISNASDALDKLRFAALTRPELSAGDAALRIRLERDPAARTLTVADTGIGMDHDEVVQNLGTIARSGTKAFREQLAAAKEHGGDDALPELIGQFGVGFYSAFMVADEVTVETRKAGTERGVRWRSRGDGAFTVEDADVGERGTRVILHLKETAEGEEDFLDEEVLRRVVKRYSDFVAWPIELEVERHRDGEVQRETLVLNSQKPLWTRAPGEVTADEHAQFYRQFAHDFEPPFETIHFRGEGTQEYTALLYVPQRRPLFQHDPEPRSRLSLYVKRVLIMNDCSELLPPWLRFVRGLVDSSDLPLNVSRETLQHTRTLKPIRARLVKKVIDALAKVLEKDRERYRAFFREWGALLKEGVYADDEHRDDVARLCLFATSRGDGEDATLDEVVERVPFKQKELYYLAGPDRSALERSPLLEVPKKKGFEVLFLTDPVDEFALARLERWKDRPIRSLETARAELEDEDEKSARERREQEQKPLLDAVKEALGERVRDVRFTNRLDQSPAVLVSAEDGVSRTMAKVLRDARQDVPEAGRILELNGGHPLVARLEQERAAEGGRFADLCELLHDQARLALGEPLSDPAAFSARLTRLLA